VHLQLDPGASIIVRGYREPIAGPAFGYYQPARGPWPLPEAWRLEFIDGGPELPTAVPLAAPGSWTELGTVAARAFSGRASYTITFRRPRDEAAHWRLDLGDVRESARVRLNGRELGTLIGPGYRLRSRPRCSARRTGWRSVRT
jgi:hypothetical protein